jgi:hypothetical protein
MGAERPKSMKKKKKKKKKKQKKKKKNKKKKSLDPSRNLVASDTHEVCAAYASPANTTPQSTQDRW